MRVFISLLLAVSLMGCATSEVNYFDFPVSKADQQTVAKDLAWLIKAKHGASAVFDFDYPTHSSNPFFSESLEMELRKLQAISIGEMTTKQKDRLRELLSKLQSLS
mgnify:CR=1 FL=1